MTSSSPPRPGTPGKLVSESLSNVFQLAQSALSADIWDTRPHDSGNYKIRCDCSRTFRPLKAVYSTGLSTVKNICFTLTFPRCPCPKQGLACIPTAEAEGFTLGWVKRRPTKIGLPTRGRPIFVGLHAL